MLRALALLAVLAAAVALAAPATAAADPRDQVVITGSVTVGLHQSVGDVVIVDGPATIFGRVNGDVVAVHGRVRVLGGR
jgi:hypothetical protein